MTHPSFVLERDEYVHELKARALVYRHKQTGARLVSVVIDDENKVFGIAFRTPPADSTGLPHILEHSVLAGSKKYPLKDPFFELVKGSLKTFLNAFTSSDFTAYPVASTNLKDFYNLIDVYFDAVFFPLLEPHHLQQEGWHIEIESADAEPTYKGVVFNEMKGSYSSPDGLLYQRSQQSLFPDTPYRYDSGGDPQNIPDLTYDTFHAFHESHYHPSNAFVFFYGDDDPDKRLEVAASWLDRFDAKPFVDLPPLQAAFDAPRRFEFPYGLDADSDTSRKTLLRIGWLLPEQGDEDLNMALSVLSYALIATQASPLRRRLLESGLGEDVGGGISADHRQMTFSVGMKNLRAEDVNAAESLILDSIREIADEGFDDELVEAALNSFDFSLRENNTGGSPRGLSLFLHALGNWLYGLDPIESMRYEETLATARRAVEDRSLLPSLIRTWLIDNPHRIRVVLTPDAGYNDAIDAQEMARLRKIRAAMTDEDVARAIATTRELRERQALPDPPELLALLPSLTLGDLERTQRHLPIAVEPLGDATLLTHDLRTNGIAYCSLAFDMRGLPQDLLPWADVFTQCLTQMGTEREDYAQLSQRIDRKTGGVGASLLISPMKEQKAAHAWMTVGGKATLAHTEDLFAILRDILLTARVDNRDRLRQIAVRTKARMEAGLAPSGHGVVDGRLRAALSAAGWADEQVDGIDNLFFQRRLVDMIENDHDHVVESLEAVRAAIVTRTHVIANLTLDEEETGPVRAQLAALLESLPNTDPAPQAWQPGTYLINEGLAIPAQVNYVGKGANLFDVGYKHHGSIHVINNVLRSDYLLQRIRVQGGAYGAFANYSRLTGGFRFVSYRDPNVLATLKVYDEAAAWLRRVNMSERELTRSIIGAISSFDPYLLPDAKGRLSMRYYLIGDSDEDLQRERDEILGTTVREIRDFGDALHAAMKNARVVVLGSGDSLAAANQGRAWLTITRIL